MRAASAQEPDQAQLPQSVHRYSPTRQHAEEDDEDDAWISHRPAHLAFELHVLFDVDGQAVQNRVENAADLTGLNEVHVKMIEDLGVSPERLAERRALLDARFDVAQDDPEVLVVGLSLQDIETLDDGQTRIDHRRKQAGERDEVFRTDAGADTKR